MGLVSRRRITTAANNNSSDALSFPLQFEYTGDVQSVTLPAGTYTLKCWGAQGGSYQTNYGGYGGYSQGTITLNAPTAIYVYVGGQPATNSTAGAVTTGGWNGGGNGANRSYNGTYTYGQGGGGASDIRINSTSLYAKVIVAGGGGGSASNGDERSSKCGGGTSGGKGGVTSSTAKYIAGQTAPSSSSSYKAGTFGVGASAATSARLNYKYGSGGGGGGWYGGFAYNTASKSSTSYRGYNGGGSGYVYTSSTASNYPSGCLLNNNYYLSNASTTAGNVEHRQGNGLIQIIKIA